MNCFGAIMGESRVDNEYNTSTCSGKPNSPSVRLESSSVSNINGRAASVGKSQYTLEYLSFLLKDKKNFEAFPNVFHCAERLVDEEISKVRLSLFQFEFAKDSTINLPDPEGEIITLTEKIFVPVKEHPDYNFVGRILGPRGMTAKQLEQETGCKIMVRGKGSMRDRAKEEMNRGKPNWEHLSEELHVLVQCEDTTNRANLKLKRTVAEVKKLLVPSSEDDELKRKQLMELAILNGTYRSGSITPTSAQAVAVANKNSLAALQARFMPQISLPAQQAGSLRAPALAAPSIILQQPRTTNHMAASAAAAALAAQLQAVASQQQQQNAAAAAALSHQAVNSPVTAAGLPSNLLQSQTFSQGDYNQLYLNSLQYDAANAAYGMPVASQNFHAQQQQYAAAAAAAAAMLGASYLGDYSGMDLANAGAMLNNQRRVLGQARDHPYLPKKSTT